MPDQRGASPGDTMNTHIDKYGIQSTVRPTKQNKMLGVPGLNQSAQEIMPAAKFSSRDIETDITLLDSFKTGSPISAGQSKSVAKNVVQTLAYPEALKAQNSNINLAMSNDAIGCFLLRAVDISKASTSDIASLRSAAVGRTLTKDTTAGSRSLIHKIQDAATGAIRATMDGYTKGFTRSSSVPTIQNTVANILLPFSQSDTDTITNTFNSNKQSRVDKANGQISNGISQAFSEFFSSALEQVAGGVNADNNEQLYSAARQTFSGTDAREKQFVWDISPQSQTEQAEVQKIFRTLETYAYGTVKSQAAAQSQLLDAGADSLLDFVAPTGGSEGNTDFVNKIVTDTAGFFKNAQVISNPTVWFIQKLGAGGASESVFGPAHIKRISIDKAPDGEYTPSALDGTKSMNYRLTIDFIEITPWTRSSL